MNDLDAVPANEDTVMTEFLQRLFRHARCDPGCHACGKRIKLGDEFKLLSHRKAPTLNPTDEMCCAKCGEHELVLRDKRDLKARHQYLGQKMPNQFGRVSGYSRPSKP